MASPHRLFARPLALAALASAAFAGGTPENAILIVDPGNAESLYVANYYAAMRDVPGVNFVHMTPGATNYAAFVADNLPGFLGTLSLRRLEDHADYVIIPPGGSFYVDAPGYISDGCVPVRRFSIAAGYAMARNSDDILGGLPSTVRNHYSRVNYNPAAFDSEISWYLGAPSNDPAAKRYFIAGMLGYTGSLGNTLPDILAMIDRSIAVDGTRPTGTVYYMETQDYNRSSPRHQAYPTAVKQIIQFKGQAQHLLGNLPFGNHDCMGVMTGLANPDIDNPAFSLLPGSFADHLTSFAGRFDTSSQVKMSRWIAKGASGTAGTVEEPCNYGGKFPHARVHVEYFKGLSLGEAWFRSVLFVPFQLLFYGDPLTRAYAYLPTVDVPNPPTGPVAGTITITPSAQTGKIGFPIDQLELLVDGVTRQTIADGQSFTLDTTVLADGWHDLRVLAHDSTAARNTDRWIGSLDVNNRGLSVSLAAAGPTSGDLATRFDLDVNAVGAGLREVRLVSNGRVVASTTQAAATLSVHGQNLGAGPRVRVQAEALFTGGARARSAPVDLVITYAPGTPAGTPPVAYDFIKHVRPDTAVVLELPASFGEDVGSATFTVLTPPARATVLTSGSGPYRVIQPDPGATCSDSLTFQVTTSAGTSNVATVTLEYGRASSRVYGCGVNPPGSMTVLSGSPTVGGTVVLGLDDPTGSVAPGAIPIVYTSNAPDRHFPCGSLWPMLGAGGPGELLVRFSPSNQALAPTAGSPWSGPGNPAPVSLALPNDCTLIGSSLYAQGMLLDPSSAPWVRLVLTDAVKLNVGP